MLGQAATVYDKWTCSRAHVSSKETQILFERMGTEIGEEPDGQAEITMNDGVETSSRPEELRTVVITLGFRDCCTHPRRGPQEAPPKKIRARG